MDHAMIELAGAPDDLIGTPEGKSSPVQVMQIELSQDVLDELLECTRNGKPPQILFGRKPRLEYGSKSQLLEPSAEKSRHELYSYHDASDGEQHWDFAGLVSHSLQLQKLQQSFQNSDKALETLRNTVASINEQREAEKAIISTTDMSMSRSSKLHTRSSHLRTPSLLANSPPSNSPSLSATGSPPLRPAPTSGPIASINAPKHAMYKQVTMHFLASGPKSEAECLSTTLIPRPDLMAVLPQCATKSNTDKDGLVTWKLNDKSYKNLDYFSTLYDEQWRHATIDRAIRAFDRMRIPKENNLWQMLLPETERGKGKCLSRLGNMSQVPRVGTPATGAQKFKVNPKTGLPKPNKEKRPRAAADDKTMEHKGETNSKPQSRPVKEATSTSKGPVKRNTTSHAGTPPARPKGGKPAAPAKAPAPVASKPKNPSPLSSSPPVNASDFERDHPVHKRLAASASPAKKRKADDAAAMSTPIAKARKVTNGASIHTNGVNNNPHPPAGSSSDSHSPSPPLTLSWRQQVEQAKKFKKYYEKYEKLWHQLADDPKPPSAAAREELMRMHDRLLDMKREINGGSITV